MNCPACKDAQLVMTERQGVEIDYCPTCRGVWLDRGELDKIIERSLTTTVSAQPLQSMPMGQGGYHAGHDDDHYKDGHYKDGRRKKSFLSDLFD
jgi:Zn-finger nucleic acid-binding protein